MKKSLAAALTGILVSYSSMALAEIGANVVANINGREISKEEFDRRYKENLQVFKFTAPTKANVLNDIINFELAVQEAKRLGLDKNTQVQERLNAVLYQTLIESQLSDKFNKVVDVTEKDARDFCKRNPAIRTSHIYVSLKPTSLKAEEAAAQKKIREALAALSKGEKFEQVVAKYSEGFATGSGGDVGYQTKDKLDPVYYMEARKLKVGGVSSQPIRSQFGLHLIKLTGVQDCNSINVVEWQRIVFDERRAKVFETYLGDLRSKAKVSINDAFIKE